MVIPAVVPKAAAAVAEAPLAVLPEGTSNPLPKHTPPVLEAQVTQKLLPASPAEAPQGDAVTTDAPAEEVVVMPPRTPRVGGPPKDTAGEAEELVGPVSDIHSWGWANAAKIARSRGGSFGPHHP